MPSLITVKQEEIKQLEARIDFLRQEINSLLSRQNEYIYCPHLRSTNDFHLSMEAYFITLRDDPAALVTFAVCPQCLRTIKGHKT